MASMSSLTVTSRRFQYPFSKLFSRAMYISYAPVLGQLGFQDEGENSLGGYLPCELEIPIFLGISKSPFWGDN
jgi:hypothetical protein